MPNSEANHSSTPADGPTRYSWTVAPKPSWLYSFGTHVSPIVRQKDSELQSSAPLVRLHKRACSTQPCTRRQQKDVSKQCAPRSGPLCGLRPEQPLWLQLPPVAVQLVAGPQARFFARFTQPQPIQADVTNAMLYLLVQDSSGAGQWVICTACHVKAGTVHPSSPWHNPACTSLHPTLTTSAPCCVPTCEPFPAP
jgi:hypothetical protein